MQLSKSPVEAHYHQEGIFEYIAGLLKAQGKEKISVEDISLADEFHFRGAAVSLQMAAGAGLNDQMVILDVGCDMGGPCRMFA